jgi:hypothetical protein
VGILLRRSLLLLVGFLVRVCLMRPLLLLFAGHESTSVEAIRLKSHLHTLWLLSNRPRFVFYFFSNFSGVWNLNLLIQNEVMFDRFWRYKQENQIRPVPCQVKEGTNENQFVRPGTTL